MTAVGSDAFREVAPGMYWMQELGPDRRHMVETDGEAPAWCPPGHDVHIPQCAYLLCGEQSLLFDTLSPASTAFVLETVDRILDGDDLDYLVVSHPDVPHAGNTMAILREYPDATLVAPGYGHGHELYHLAESMQVIEGDSIDLGGLEVAFHEATFLDAPLSVWMTERTTDTLFPVDWLGFPHLDSEALRFVDELEHDVGRDRLYQFHGRVMFWYQYVDAAKVTAEIDRLIERYDPAVIAPAHGLVVREEPRRYMQLMKPVVERIADEGRIGAVG